MSKPLRGRKSIYRGKLRDKPIRAILTAIGHVAFRRARKDLARTAQLPVEEVSLNDTFEHVLRGEPQLTQNADGTYRVAAPSVEPKP